MLIVFGGLPGTGKTTIAREVAERCRAAYLRIDAIEQAIRSSNVLAGEIGPAGYAVAYALAEANLKLGRVVVADGVNPLPVTREAWRSVAASSASAIVEIEVVCSDAVEHRQRVEGRTADIPGLIPPTWEAVLNHDYQAWSGPRVVIDTALLSAGEAVLKVCGELEKP